MTEQYYEERPAVDMLTTIFGKQFEMQVFHYGQDPATLDTIARISYLRDMSLAGLDEIHELLHEIGWKPWATSRHVNVENARSEVIDLMHFVLALAIGLGMTPKMFFEKFLEKQEENRRRAFSGTYDGVSGKCVYCTRDVGDVQRAMGMAPVELPSKDGSEIQNWMCGQCALERGDQPMPRIEPVQ